MTRVVSLVPSVTETLLSWGVVPVACTRFCQQPGIVHVGGTKDPRMADIVRLTPDLVVLDEDENRREDCDALVAAGLTVHVTAVRSLDGKDLFWWGSRSAEAIERLALRLEAVRRR